MAASDRRLKHVVAFGGSAGSLPVILKQVRQMLGPDQSCLFVIYHRTGNTPFDLNRFMDRASGFEAVMAQEGTPIRANRVYHPKLSENLAVENGRLRISDPSARPHPNIDLLFTSLAKEYKDRLVAVLLSGLGRDGVQGLDAVKQEGGTTIVQSPEHCQFPALPLAALEADVVQHVLPTDDLVGFIARILSGEKTAVARISRPT
jgi:chemotaxis response regulator CheB